MKKIDGIHKYQPFVIYPHEKDYRLLDYLLTFVIVAMVAVVIIGIYWLIRVTL